MQIASALAIATTLFISSTAFGWANRAQVIRAADTLQQEVEIFDEALHEINAPHDLIELVHHYEETVGEFVYLAQSASYQEAQAEMSHIRQDIGLIRNKLSQYSWVLNYPTVTTEWRHVRTAYRYLDH